MFLLIFFLSALFLSGAAEVSKFPAMIVDFSICPSRSINNNKAKLEKIQMSTAVE